MGYRHEANVDSTTLVPLFICAKLHYPAPMLDEINKFLTSHAAEWSLSLALAAVIIITGWMLAKLLSRGVRRLATRSADDLTLPLFLASAIRYLVLLLALLLALGTAGVETSSLVALLGAAGLAIGLALQGTLADVAAGVVMLAVRPFRIGDLIESNSFTGRVQSINLFNTELVTADNRKIMLPNAFVWKAPIINLSMLGARRVDIILPLVDAGHMKNARDIAVALLRSSDGVHHDPTPAVGADLLADGAQLVASFWCDAGKAAELKATMADALTQQLLAQDIALAMRANVQRLNRSGA